MRVKIGRKTYDTDESRHVYTLVENFVERKDVLRRKNGDLFVYTYQQDQDNNRNESIQIYLTVEAFCNAMEKYDALMGVMVELAKLSTLKEKQYILHTLGAKLIDKPAK